MSHVTYFSIKNSKNNDTYKSRYKFVTLADISKLKQAFLVQIIALKDIETTPKPKLDSGSNQISILVNCMQISGVGHEQSWGV